jgi:hypothetical protein
MLTSTTANHENFHNKPFLEWLMAYMAGRTFTGPTMLVEMKVKAKVEIM